MVAGERRRPAASSTGETVMGSPPNRTADTEPAALPALTHPRQRHHLQIALSLRPGGAEAGGSSARHPALVQSGRLKRDRDTLARDANRKRIPSGPPELRPRSHTPEIVVSPVRVRILPPSRP